MRVTAGIEQAWRAVTTLDTATAGLADVTSALGAVRRLQGFLASEAIDLARRVTELSPVAEQVVAKASGTSMRDAMAVLDRAAVVDEIPALGAALADGTIGAGHVDGFGRALRSLDSDRRAELVAAAPALVVGAGSATVQEFSRTVLAEVRRIDADHGLALLERQRRACRLSTWVDSDGMWRLAGQFDPVTGARLAARLRGAAGRLEAAGPAAEAPEDPIERQSFVRAHALAALVDGQGRPGGLGELVIALEEVSAGVCEWRGLMEIPARSRFSGKDMP